MHQAAFEYICVFNCPNSEEQMSELRMDIINVEKKEIFKQYKANIKPDLAALKVRIAGGITFKEALEKMHESMKELKLFGTEFIFIAFNDYDGKRLQTEALQNGINLRSYLKRWISLSKVCYRFNEQRKPDFTSMDAILSVSDQYLSLREFLEAAELADIEKNEPTLDSCSKIAKCVLKLL